MQSAAGRLLLVRSTTLTATAKNHARAFASSHRRTRKRSECPFTVLGVKEDDPYHKVKAAFIKIAMSHHPDTADKSASQQDKDAYRDIFIKARSAFESLAQGPDGNVVLKSQQEELQDFDAWFKSETGHDTPFQFMDAETMKEVAEMEDTIGHGLDRDGGMWMLASMVGNAVKNGRGAESLLRLESGNDAAQQKDDKIDGVLRRRRRSRR